MKILTKVPASVLEQRGSRPSPQGRQADQQLDFQKAGNEGGRTGYSAFASKAKGFSLVREDMQKQISNYQNLMKKAQGGHGSSQDDAMGRADIDKQPNGHSQERQGYLDQRYGPAATSLPEKSRYDHGGNEYDNSLLGGRTEQRVGDYHPGDRGETLPVQGMAGGSALEQFDESHYSWRSAAHNQRNAYAKFSHHQQLNRNDESRLYKEGDDTASFLEPNDNTSISASASANYGNLHNQSSFSNLGKPPSSSFAKHLQSMKDAYQSKI